MPNDRYQNVSEIINALNICKNQNDSFIFRGYSFKT